MNEKKPQVVTGRVEGESSRPKELELLNAFIGRWMTEGETVANAAPAKPIVASDVYEWLPGRHFVMHTAYGRIGEIGVGGLEVTGFDPATGQFKSHLFDSFGNATVHSLAYRDGKWYWLGTNTRCEGTPSSDGKTMVARHERSDDGVHWTHSMTVTLRRID